MGRSRRLLVVAHVLACCTVTNSGVSCEPVQQLGEPDESMAMGRFLYGLNPRPPRLSLFPWLSLFSRLSRLSVLGPLAPPPPPAPPVIPVPPASQGPMAPPAAPAQLDWAAGYDHPSPHPATVGTATQHADLGLSHPINGRPSLRTSSDTFPSRRTSSSAWAAKHRRAPFSERIAPGGLCSQFNR